MKRKESVSVFPLEKRQTPSLSKVEGVCLLYIEESVFPFRKKGRLLLYQRQTPSLSKGESVSLLYSEEADFFSMDSFSMEREESLASL